MCRTHLQSTPRRRHGGSEHRPCPTGRVGFFWLRTLSVGIVLLAGFSLGIGYAHYATPHDESEQSLRGASPSVVAHVPTVDDLVAMDNETLARIDPVVMSLVVAREIPAFADLDIETYVNAVDAWAEEVRHDTERHWLRFEQDPAAFNNSRIDYEISWLASDINSWFQVDYDVLDFDFSDSPTSS